ncbi:hypothetical protein F4777DRAFT_598609 [Nemania sp. FL0916]|nr:hypothetical protein F4777DRAFT_598609 [Nemania sp. FL0916]
MAGKKHVREQADTLPFREPPSVKCNNTEPTGTKEDPIAIGLDDDNRVPNPISHESTSKKRKRLASDIQTELDKTRQGKAALFEEKSRLLRKVDMLEGRLKDQEQQKNKELSRAQTVLEGFRAIAFAVEAHHEKLRADNTEQKQRLDEALTELGVSRNDITKLNSELEEARKANEDLSPFKFLAMTREIDLDSAVDSWREAKEKQSQLESRVEDLEADRIGFQGQMARLERTLKTQIRRLKSDKLMLQSQNNDLAKSEIEAALRTDTRIQSLQDHLDKTLKECELMKTARDDLQKELKDVTSEREQLCRRINQEGRETAELGTGKRLSRIAGVALELQAAQGQINEMNKHIESCPIMQNSKEFWDQYDGVTRWLDGLRPKGLPRGFDGERAPQAS